MRSSVGGRCLLFTAAVSLSTLTISVRGDVVLDTSSVSKVYDATSTPPDTSTTITSLPSAGVDINSNGGDDATSVYAVGTTAFSIQVNQNGHYGGSAANIFFTPTDATTSYALNGGYSFSNPTVILYVELFDVTMSGATVGEYYEETDKDKSSSSGTFTVGAPITGEFGISSNLSGLLTLGHEYDFFYDADISPASTGIASGTLGISFTDSAVVTAAPLPSTAFAGLGLLGGLGVLMFARRRKVTAE